MLLERSLSATFRNLSTLFLVAFVVLFPLHLVHSYVFRSVIEVRELHDEIADFPPLRQVHGVGAKELERARISFWALSLLELLALPLGTRAARGVLAEERAGEIPTVPSALRAIRKPLGSTGWAPGSLKALGVVALIGAASGWLFEGAGSALVQMLSDRAEFAGLALVQASARALAASFVLVALAEARTSATRDPESIDLY